MSVLVTRETRVVVQGITGHQGTVHTRQMQRVRDERRRRRDPREGRHDGRGGPRLRLRPGGGRDHARERVLHLRPCAVREGRPARGGRRGDPPRGHRHGAHPVPRHARDVPLRAGARSPDHRAELPGDRVPGRCEGRDHPERRLPPGTGRRHLAAAGTLTYEIVNGIKEHGLGQSTCIGLGGDPVVGTSFVDALPLFEEDPETDLLVLVGEIGGTAEEEGAELHSGTSSRSRSSPTSPGGALRRESGWDTPARSSPADGAPPSPSSRRCEDAGARVARFPYEIPDLVAEIVARGSRR